MYSFRQANVPLGLHLSRFGNPCGKETWESECPRTCNPQRSGLETSHRSITTKVRNHRGRKARGSVESRKSTSRSTTTSVEKGAVSISHDDGRGPSRKQLQSKMTASDIPAPRENPRHTQRPHKPRKLYCC